MRNNEMGENQDQGRDCNFCVLFKQVSKNDKVKDQNPLKQSETENKGHESSTTVFVGDIRNGQENREMQPAKMVGCM